MNLYLCLLVTQVTNRPMMNLYVIFSIIIKKIAGTEFEKIVNMQSY